MLNKPNAGIPMWGMDVVVTSSAGLWVPLSQRKQYRTRRPLYGERCRVLGQYRRPPSCRAFTEDLRAPPRKITKPEGIKPAALVDQANNRIYVHPKVYGTLVKAFQADRSTFTADDTWIRRVA